jgi:DNA-binding HxlR family transcriptional regulator
MKRSSSASPAAANAKPAAQKAADIQKPVTHKASRSLRQRSNAILGKTRNHAEEIQALQDTIYVIGGKWKLPIINSLCNGNRRFREIERSIPGITTRMLARELREMELNGIVRRLQDPDFPKKVEYETTDYCYSFGSIILEMIQWGKQHKKKVMRPAS